MADQLSKKQLKAVAEAMKKLVDGDLAPTAAALSEAVGFEVSEEVAGNVATELYPADKEPAVDPMPIERPADIPDATAEACVEVAAVLTNRAAGIEPDGLTLLYKCGQRHVDAVEKAGAEPDAVAAWACAEARRRSPALNHKAIVAQSIV